MMGIIYKIENKINNKVYIGQSIHNNLKVRLTGHKYTTNYSNNEDSLHGDIRKFGIDNFEISVICECNNYDLNDLEIEYIEKYKSNIVGYNKTAGGAGCKIIKDTDIDNVINLINDNRSITDIQAITGFDYRYIKDIMYDLNIEYQYKNNKPTRPKQIVMYDSNWNPIGTFSNILEAYKWLNTHYKNGVDKRNVYRYIKIACGRCGIAFGYRWQKVEDIISDCNTFYYLNKEVKEKHRNGKDIEVIDGIARLKYNETVIIKDTKCAKCGKQIYVGATYCVECYRQNKRAESKRPSRNELIELLKRYNYTEIGRKFGVTGNAVKKWKKLYKIDV